MDGRAVAAGDRGRVDRVIPVRVTDQKMDAPDTFIQKFISQLPDTCPAIQNDDCSIVDSEFYAGGVAAIFCGFRARCWYRTPCSPKSY